MNFGLRIKNRVIGAGFRKIFLFTKPGTNVLTIMIGERPVRAL